MALIGTAESVDTLQKTKITHSDSIILLQRILYSDFINLLLDRFTGIPFSGSSLISSTYSPS
jgi:hypothetical protein